MSDAALVGAARTGDDEAADLVLARHEQALVAALPGHQQQIRVAAQGLLDGEQLGLPLRAAWLAAVAGVDLADLRMAAHDDPVLHAFAQLSPAWQTAVWHHEVEGEGLDAIGWLLGGAAEDARLAIAAGRGSMRRRIAHSHAGGTSPRCLVLCEHLRQRGPADLDAGLARDLREHGRHCDACLPLIRDAFRMEFGLPHLLVEAVSGTLAATYLSRARTRRRPRRLGTAAAPPIRRPSLVAALSLTAAAVLGLVVVSATHRSEVASAAADPSQTGPRTIDALATGPGSGVRVQDRRLTPGDHRAPVRPGSARTPGRANVPDATSTPAVSGPELPSTPGSSVTSSPTFAGTHATTHTTQQHPTGTAHPVGPTAPTVPTTPAAPGKPTVPPVSVEVGRHAHVSVTVSVPGAPTIHVGTPALPGVGGRHG